jgi:predicted ATP-grasp superfamily ATP-dependent carboligase
MDYNTSKLGFKSRLIKSMICPDPKTDEKYWLDFLLNWLKQQSQKIVIIPTSDEFALLCASHEKDLSPFALSLIPDVNSLHAIIERDLQFNAAKACNIPVPAFITYNEIENKELIDELRFPLAIKPVNTVEWKKQMNNKGFIVENPTSYYEIIRELKEKKLRFLIQEMILGENENNYEVNSLYFPSGKILQHSIQKIRQYPDRFGTATSIKNCIHPEIEKMAADYIRHLNLIGFTNIEFKLNQSDGKYYYIETNTRVWLQVNFSANIGINFPMYYYNQLTNKEVAKNKNFQELKNGVWVDFMADLLFWKKHRKQYKLSFFKLIRSWFPLRATGLFSITDPKPLLTELRSKKIFKNH